MNKLNLSKSGRSTFRHPLPNGQVDVYHCYTKENLVLLCYASPEAKLRIVYNFLAELDELYSKGESGMEFLKSLLDKWNKPDADKLNASRVKVEQIKQVMIQNIEKALVRGAAMSELEDRSSSLASSAIAFEKSAQQLKCKFLKEKWKLIAIIVGVIVVIIIIIVVSVVVSNPPDGPDGPSDDSSSSDSRRLLRDAVDVFFN